MGTYGRPPNRRSRAPYPPERSEEGRSSTVQGYEIEVSSDGRPWLIALNTYDVYRWNGSSFVKLTGCARDIAIGPNDDAWVIGCSEADALHNRKIWRWNPATQQFVHVPGMNATQIAVQSNASVWISVNTQTGGVAHQRSGNGWVNRGAPPGGVRALGGGGAQASTGSDYFTYNASTGAWDFFISDDQDGYIWLSSWGPGPLYGIGFTSESVYTINIIR